MKLGTGDESKRPKAVAPEVRGYAVVDCCVVGVGASAGGVVALKRLLGAVPPGSGLAFVLVQHLDPTHESQLADILSRCTTMTVKEGTDGTRVEPDHVYTIPPNRNVTVEGGLLRLSPMADRRDGRFPIDVLLRSLAEDFRERSVAVLLSGTGTDGTAGVKVVKSLGGAVLVQDPKTAEHPGMPQSAIDTGLVDRVLAIEDIPDALVKYASHPYARGQSEEDVAREQDGVQAVVAVLRKQGAFDFRSYKSGTLTRRIMRRMGLHHLESFSEYVSLLQEDPEEVERLRRDLLINVTQFFRDAEAYEELAQEVVEKLVGEDAPERVRVWVPGCSTGEEAYSIAMLFHEKRSGELRGSLQVFATDVNDDGLNVARAGVYDEGSLTDVPPERVTRFFLAERPHHLRVKPSVREVVTFARQDLMRDPPFSRMDLISCRNVMIYLTPEAQRRLISLFHFALKPGGYLFLGVSETAGPDARLFEPVSRKWRIYRRIGPSRPEQLDISPSVYHPPLAVKGRLASLEKPRERKLAEFAERWLLGKYAPAAVVVNRSQEIVYLHGPVERYLNLPRGEPRLDFSSMLRNGLRARLRPALHRALQDGKPTHVPGARVERDGGSVPVDIDVAPLPAHHDSERLVIITFRDVPERSLMSPGDGAPPRADPPAEDGALVRQLEDELEATKADLQGTVEAFEAANEDLKASNEEIMSMNEEFRSTNEELETSKEELQAVNEELSALNSQLREKVEALDAATNDLTNLLTSTSIPTIFLDRQFRIKRFTPVTRKLMSLIATDVGRPLADVSLKFRDDDLFEDAQRVLDELTMVEKEVRADDGRRWVRRIQPYRTQHERIEGVVITIVDVEGLKRGEDSVRKAKAYSEAAIHTLQQPLVTLAGDLRVISANPAFYKAFQVEPADTVGHLIYDLGNGQWDIPALRRLLERVFTEGPHVKGYEVRHEFPSIGRRVMILNASRVERVLEDEDAIFLVIEDVTEREESVETLRSLSAELEQHVAERTADLAHLAAKNVTLEQANESLDAFSYVVGHDLKEPVRGIDSLLDALLDDHGAKLPPDARAHVERARVANKRLSSLVTGLLEFSRASRLDVSDLRPISIAAALGSDDCVTRLGSALTAKGCRVEVPDPDVIVRASAPALCQVLGNLVLNAVKHNSKPEPRVRIRAERSPDGTTVEVVVEDDGPGYPPDVVAGFDRMNAATRGFGLAIARRTVQRMGGRMWLAESPMGGAAAHFTLPAP